MERSVVFTRESTARTIHMYTHLQGSHPQTHSINGSIIKNDNIILTPDKHLSATYSIYLHE